MTRRFRVALIALLVMAPLLVGAQDQPDPMSLIRKAVENNKENDKRAHDYMYIEREAQKMKDKTEVRTKEVFFLYGHEIDRLVAKDDKPLSDKEAKEEEERIAKRIEKLKNVSEEERRKREEKRAKEHEEERRVWDEIADAFTFTMQPVEQVSGRDAWVISAEPRKEYRPKTKEAKMLQKVRFRAWIDKQETQMVRIDGDVIDDITFGLFLAKLQKGAHFTVEQMRVNDEVWLPQHVAVNAGARLLFKHFDFNDDLTYRDYRKFRTETKITGIVDPQSPPPPPHP